MTTQTNFVETDAFLIDKATSILNHVEYTVYQPGEQSRFLTMMKWNPLSCESRG